MANVEWSLKFPASTVTHLFSHASDHLPIILQTKIVRHTNLRSKNGFKFEEAWLLWDDCEDVVHEAWSTHRDATLALCDVGMATGRVRAGFFHTRARPAGLDPRPKPGPIVNGFFFAGPRPTPPGPAGSTGPVGPRYFRAHSVAQKFFFFA